MAESSFVAAHRAEMAQRCSPVYAWLEELERTAAPEVRDAVVRHGAAIADLVVWQELTVDPEALASASRKALSGAVLPAEVLFAAWRSAAEESLPSRPACTTVLHAFVGWIESLPADVRTSFAVGIGPLCSFAAEIKEAGMAEVLDAVRQLGTADRVAAMVAAMGTYRDTDAPNLLAICRLARVTLSSGRKDLLDRVPQVVSLEAMMDSRDAGRFLPALAAAAVAVQASSPALACEFVQLLLDTASQNVSSGYAAAVALPRAMKALAPDAAAAYVRGVAGVVGSAGIRLLGFCLKKLPAVYRRHGADKASAFVEQAVVVGRTQGATAAEWFLARRTAAAREALAL